jgi:RNA recognition motif-containing protein/tetratricopeptide (TPR) repeat protein
VKEKQKTQLRELDTIHRNIFTRRLVRIALFEMPEADNDFIRMLIDWLKLGKLDEFLTSQTLLPLVDGFERALKLVEGWFIEGSAGSFIIDPSEFSGIFNRILVISNTFSKFDFLNSQRIFDIKISFLELLSPDSLAKGLKYTKLKDIKLSEQHALINEAFLERLATPHIQLDETLSRYSRFVSGCFLNDYDTYMSRANKIYQSIKQQQNDLELVFTRKPEESPKQFWARLVDFGLSLSKKQRSDFLVPVFENAINYDNTVEMWTRYVHNIYEFASPLVLTSVLDRFMKHHASSSVPYTELMNTDSFTAERYSEFSNLEIFGSLPDEEWLELQTARLMYLRRLNEKTQISCETLVEEASSVLMQSWKHESNVFHSLQRAIAYLFEDIGDSEKARATWKELTKAYPQEAEGWLIRSNFEFRDTKSWSTTIKILNEALNVSENLDWPERIFEEALRVVQLHGQPGDYNRITSKIERKKTELWKVRAQGSEVTTEIEDVSLTQSHKRSADEMEECTDETEIKGNDGATAPSRDRERLTISVRNLPVSITERLLRQFFKGYGEIIDVKLTMVGGFQQANIEFASESDIQRALTKDYKTIRGNEIRVQRLQNNTLFVTNFPPTYTKDKIFELFGSVGAIASIRFPSLKFNSNRRFCYVELTETSNAQAAVGLFNGKEIDGFTLSVQISDPSSKQARSGATEEGREIYVNTLDFFKVTPSKVKQLFEKYGEVESVHLPLSEQHREQGKKNDGFGFVVFKTAEEAQKSLALDMVSFEGRVIHVSISKKKSELTEEKAKRALADISLSDSAIAVTNLPDTVSAAQLKNFFAEVDQVEDVILEPRHGGAIIVFKNPQASGKLGLELNGKKIENYTIQITSVSDLRRLQPSGNNASTTTMMMPSSMRRRKIRLLSQKSTTVSSSDTPESSDSSSSMTGRSNDDFRKMLFKK